MNQHDHKVDGFPIYKPSDPSTKCVRCDAPATFVSIAKRGWCEPCRRWGTGQRTEDERDDR
jgi:hypothetical protein